MFRSYDHLQEEIYTSQINAIVQHPVASEIKVYYSYRLRNTFIYCPPVPGGYKYGNLALQVGGVSDEIVKYGYGF
jgi:hypothetical protein